MRGNTPVEKRESWPCNADWHLDALQLKLYLRIGQITSGGKNLFYASNKTLAAFFGVDYIHLCRQRSELRTNGWLVRSDITENERSASENPDNVRLIARLRSKKKQDRWISHEEWRFAHPGKCYIHPEFTPWSDEAQDTLPILLGAASAGLKWYPPLVAAAHECFATDEAVLSAWRGYIDLLDQKPITPNAWLKAQRGFAKYCREYADERRLSSASEDEEILEPKL